MKFNFDVYQEVQFSTKTFSELEKMDYAKLTTKKEKMMKKTVYSAVSKRFQKLNELEKNIKGLFEIDFESVKFDDLRAYLTEATKYLHQQQNFWEEYEFPNAFLRIVDFLYNKFAQEKSLPKNSNFVFVEKEVKKLYQQFKEKIQLVRDEEYLEDLQISEHEEQEMTEESEDEGLDKMDFFERLQFPPELRRMFWMKVPDTITGDKKESKERQKDKLRGYIQLKKDKENDFFSKQKEIDINDIQQVRELIQDDQETIKDKDFLQLQLKLDQYDKIYTLYKQQENILSEQFYLNQLQVFERLFEYELEENNQYFKNIMESVENFLNRNNSEQINRKLIKILYLILNLFNRIIDSIDILNKNLGSILNQQQIFIQRQYQNIYKLLNEKNQQELQDQDVVQLCIELLDSIYYLQNYKGNNLDKIISLFQEFLNLNLFQDQ